MFSFFLKLKMKRNFKQINFPWSRLKTILSIVGAYKIFKKFDLKLFFMENFQKIFIFKVPVFFGRKKSLPRAAKLADFLD